MLVAVPDFAVALADLVAQEGQPVAAVPVAAAAAGLAVQRVEAELRVRCRKGP